MIRKLGQLEIIEPDWPAPENVHAVSSTRLGGVSRAPYCSLNLGSHVEDEPAAVENNRAHFSSAVNLPSPPIWLQQVHGTQIEELSAVTQDLLVADGAMTNEAGVVCCIMTADCLPLFLCDQDGEQVAAIHVGWRGLAKGIVERAIGLFKAPPKQLLAWAGPAISAKHFEVGAEVRSQLGGREDAWRFSNQEGKYFADLYKLVGDRAEGLGVGWYGNSDACTFEDNERFFSHRRDGQSGRMASVIYKF